MSRSDLPPPRGHHFLLTPGPTPIPDRILNAMHRPGVDFTSPGFRSLAEQLLRDLPPLFGTGGRVFVYAANGHGAWEAALVNCLSPGDRVLVPDTGTFSRAWSVMARRLGVETEYLEGDWRTGADPARIEERLTEDTGRRIRAVMLVHTDTSTGITSDVEAVRRAIDRADHPALLLVDAVASFLTTPLPMDAWGVDIAVTAAQKALMLPPGLSLVAAGPRALAACEEARMPRHYWDWRPRMGEESYMWFCGTAPEHLLFGLREAVDMVLEETVEGMIARHARLAEAARRTVLAWGAEGALEPNPVRPRERADAITCVRVLSGHDAERLRERCRERYQVSIGGGFGPLNGTCFRIGHMGDVNEPMLLGALAAIEVAMREVGIPHRAGGVQEAISWLAEPA